MAEEDLKKVILEKIHRERDTILCHAREEAGKIIQQARDEAIGLREGHLMEIKKLCLLKKARELNRIEQGIERQIMEKKEAGIEEVLSFVKERLKSIRKDEDYKSIFKGLLAEALENFSKDTRLRLRINPLDKALAKIDAQIELLDSIDGGVILSDLEEKVIILNTFNSRMEKLKQELRNECRLWLYKCQD